MDNYTAFNDVEKFQCRICFDDTEEKLITPCKCTGTSQYVHMSCLQKWRNIQYNTGDISKCEICNYTYKTIKKKPYWFFGLGFVNNRNPLDSSFKCSMVLALIIVLTDMIFTPLDTNNEIIKPIISNTTNINSVTNSNAHMVIYSFSLILMSLFYIGVGMLSAKLWKCDELADYKKIYSKKIITNTLVILLVNCLVTYFKYYYISLVLNLIINYVIIRIHYFGIYIVNLTSLDIIQNYISDTDDNRINI